MHLTRATSAPRLLVGVVTLALLAGCSGTSSDPATPAQTVTVTVDEPTAATDSTPVPTVPATTTGNASSTTTTAASVPSAPAPQAIGHRRGAPASYAAAVASLGAGKAAAAPAGGAFTSPTGNLRCAFTNGQGGCEVVQGRVAPPAGMTCAGDGAKDVGRVRFADGTAVIECNSDSIAAANTAPLPYGTRISLPGSSISCLSAVMGITCVDTASQHAFFVAKGTFVTF